MNTVTVKINNARIQAEEKGISFKVLIPKDELESYKKHGTSHFEIINDKIGITSIALSKEAMRALYYALDSVFKEDVKKWINYCYSLKKENAKLKNKLKIINTGTYTPKQTSNM